MVEIECLLVEHHKLKTYSKQNNVQIISKTAFQSKQQTIILYEKVSKVHTK